jgi:formylglycine-generating enzyme required for sulfatase activity
MRLSSVRHWGALLLLLAAASCYRDTRAYIPKPGTEYDEATGLPMEILSQKDGAEMVLVSAGAFKPGNPEELSRTLSVRAFYIDRTEVTNERYLRFVVSTQHAPPWGNGEGIMLAWPGDAPPPGRDSHPVVMVSAGDAKAYAQWAGKELPTRVQWEYAARGPKALLYPWGNSKLPPEGCNTSDRLAGRELIGSTMWQEWYEGWSKQDAATRNADALRPTGSFPQDTSPFGVLDMGGNVREWCLQPQTSPFDADGAPAFAANGHVACGGSWFRDAQSAQAWLYEAPADAPYYDVGFRCVLPATHPAIRVLARPVKN